MEVDDRIMIDEHEAAKLVGFTVHWLRKRRNLNLKPNYVRIGRSVRYDPADLIAFRESNMVECKESALA
jgi:hypothetical protein